MNAVMPFPPPVMGSRRRTLPRITDRITLGQSGLKVSPYCLGMTQDPETVIKAYEAGVNFFFVTADLHWPIYRGLRDGLAKLIAANPARRDELVIAVVSYLDNPLFSALQFHEVINEIPGMKRADLIIAGAVSSDQNFYSRLESLATARQRSHCGARAIGATFHQRQLALAADHYNLLDISYIRFNSAHPKARVDLLPYFRPQRGGLVFNFKSVMSHVRPEVFKSLGLPQNYWLPDPADYYRFVISRNEIDGILFSPMVPDQVADFAKAIERGPLTAEEEEYMVWLSSLAGSPALT